MTTLAGQGASWNYALTAAAGTAHQAEGAGSQDRCKVAGSDDPDVEWLVFAMCDGAGSASFGGEGADWVSNRAVEWLSSVARKYAVDGLPDKPQFQEAVREWLTAMHAELDEFARHHGGIRRDYSCTWIGGIILPDGWLIAQSGDGAAVYRQNKEWQVAVWPMQGEYANSTLFVTDDRAIRAVECTYAAGRPEAFAIFTDGLQRLALQMQQKIAFAGFLEPMYQSLNGRNGEALTGWAAQVQQWLNSPQVCAKTDDDKTLLWVVSR